MNKTERWKDIPGFANYAVSDKGRVKNTYTDKILNPIRTATKQHGEVGLYKLGIRHSYQIKRLVAEAFLKGYDPNLVVAYIIEEGDDNSVENLRMSHKTITGQRRRKSDAQEV